MPRASALVILRVPLPWSAYWQHEDRVLQIVYHSRKPQVASFGRCVESHS